MNMIYLRDKASSYFCIGSVNDFSEKHNESVISGHGGVPFCISELTLLLLFLIVRFGVKFWISISTVATVIIVSAFSLLRLCYFFVIKRSLPS